MWPQSQPVQHLENMMSSAVTCVCVRVDTTTKARVANALEATGRSLSDAMRLLMFRIADESCLPSEVKAPSSSHTALAEVKAGKVERIASVDDLVADLCADNRSS